MSSLTGNCIQGEEDSIFDNMFGYSIMSFICGFSFGCAIITIKFFWSVWK